jgi:hypothetical protein
MGLDEPRQQALAEEAHQQDGVPLRQGLPGAVHRHPGDELRRYLIVQPLFTRPFDVEQRNRRGDSATFEGLEAALPIDTLEHVRDQKGEFLITVVGRSEEKDFKVKQKHLDDLGLVPLRAVPASPHS